MVKKTASTLFVTCIMIIKVSHYISCFLKQAQMQQVMMDKLNVCIFLIEDDDLCEKYNAVWDKVSADIKK